MVVHIFIYLSVFHSAEKAELSVRNDPVSGVIMESHGQIEASYCY